MDEHFEAAKDHLLCHNNYLMRHDANTGRIFVDEDMIRALVGALGEDVSDTVALAVIGERERQ